MRDRKTCEQFGFTWVDRGSSGYCYTNYQEYVYTIGSGWSARTETCSVLTTGSCSQWSSMVRYKANSSLIYYYCRASANNNLEKFVCDTVYY